MYERNSRRRDRLIEHFVAGTTVRAAAETVAVHWNTAASYFTRLRKVIAGEIEVGESYFGGVRKGRRGRGGAGKVPVWGC